MGLVELGIRDYLQIAEGSYIWRNIPSYEKSASKSVVKMPKGNFRDSGLSNFIQGIADRKQLFNYPNVGAAFEAFISEEIIKGIQATDVVNWNYYYFRTRDGAEIDLILEGPFGSTGRRDIQDRGEAWWRRRESNRRQLFKNSIISNSWFSTDHIKGTFTLQSVHHLVNIA